MGSLLVASWWALILAAMPYPIGIGAGLITGRYAFLGEGWLLVALVTAVIGPLWGSRLACFSRDSWHS